MPFLTRDGARLWWRSDGDSAKPVLVVGNSLGTDTTLWDPVLPQLVERFRVIRFDMRGHGASDATPGDYTIEMLARDGLAVADAAGAAKFCYAGISIGGMIGQWLGANAGNRIDKLVLSTTTAKSNPDVWASRIQAVQSGGMAAIAEAVIGRWFTAGFIKKNPPRVASARSTLLATDPVGYLGCCAAIRDMDLTTLGSRIQVSTLVITATHDHATPKEQGEAIAKSIAGARIVELPYAHIAIGEAPGRFVDALLRFLLADEVESERDRYDVGLERRKEALGREYVEGRLKSINAFNAEFQDFITRYAWGEIWTRHVLDDRTRRLVVLGMMLALGRLEEFQMHVRSGLAAELAVDELKEVLLLSAIYAGVPAANSGFHKAAEVLAE
ncbi:MAG TPA: 3-oxoadipate enol-lactonase [Casimicrobiaceae bacterium]|nr:3-oxoadipate enol-lactonase [Casimicrobiaceae bacterium]